MSIAKSMCTFCWIADHLFCPMVRCQRLDFPISKGQSQKPLEQRREISVSCLASAAVVVTLMWAWSWWRISFIFRDYLFQLR